MSVKEFKFRPGIEARDKITGFKGIVSCRAQYLTGCNQYLLQPPTKEDGTIPDAIQFDENRLEEIGVGVADTFWEVEQNKPEEQKAPGGPAEELLNM